MAAAVANVAKEITKIGCRYRVRWNLLFNNKVYPEVVLVHSKLTGLRKIYINGRQSYKGRQFFDIGGEYEFFYERHHFYVTIDITENSKVDYKLTIIQ